MWWIRWMGSSVSNTSVDITARPGSLIQIHRQYLLANRRTANGCHCSLENSRSHIFGTRGQSLGNGTVISSLSHIIFKCANECFSRGGGLSASHYLLANSQACGNGNAATNAQRKKRHGWSGGDTMLPEIKVEGDNARHDVYSATLRRDFLASAAPRLGIVSTVAISDWNHLT